MWRDLHHQIYLCEVGGHVQALSVQTGHFPAHLDLILDFLHP